MLKYKDYLNDWKTTRRRVIEKQPSIAKKVTGIIICALLLIFAYFLLVTAFEERILWNIVV